MSLPLQLLLTEFHRILLTESHHNQAITWLCLLFSIPSCASVSAKLLQSCLTLCDCMDSSPPGSSVHGILQARILEWVAMPSSRGILPTQRSNLRPLCLLALAGRFLLPSHQGMYTNKCYWNTTTNTGSLNIHGCFYRLSYRSKVALSVTEIVGTIQLNNYSSLKQGPKREGISVHM